MGGIRSEQVDASTSVCPGGIIGIRSFRQEDQRKLLNPPDAETLEGLRDRAILSVGLQVGLRRAENRHPESRRLHQNRSFDSLRVIRKGGLRPEERGPVPSSIPPLLVPHCRAAANGSELLRAAA